MTDLYRGSGFDFSNVIRNNHLESKGVRLPKATSTGTTIVGCLFKGGIVLGADLRAIEGPIVADKNCEKIHYISESIRCCGAGAAADIEFTTALISPNIEMHALSTGRKPRVVTATTMLKQILFRYQGHIGAAPRPCANKKSTLWLLLSRLVSSTIPAPVCGGFHNFRSGPRVLSIRLTTRLFHHYPSVRTNLTSGTDLLKIFVQVESAIQSTKPTLLYAGVLAKVHSTIASDHFGLQPPSAKEDAAFGASIADWEPLPDTRGALRRLSKHYKLVILSNVDRASFAHTKRKLEDGSGFTFDLILTAQDIGSYKPDSRNFQFALRRVKEEWGVECGQVLSTAQSLFPDHVPANKLGLKSSWIARRGSVVGAKESDLEEEGVKVTYTWQFETLGAMADEAEKQFAESG